MVIHGSMILVLVGGVIRIAWGEKGFIGFREGEVRNAFMTADGPVQLPFAVRLEKFTTEFYEEETDPGGKENDLGTLFLRWKASGKTSELPVQLGVEKVVTPEDQPVADKDTTYVVKVTRFVPDFVVDLSTREVTTRSDVPRNPAILVEIRGLHGTLNRWLFAKHPDFDMHMGDPHATQKIPVDLLYHYHPPSQQGKKIKDWKSTLVILEDGKEVRRKTIEVNFPLTYRKYTFYQSGYDKRRPDWTSLQVVNDPGVPVVYAGFALMIAGLFVVFYVSPWMAARAKKT